MWPIAQETEAVRARSRYGAQARVPGQRAGSEAGRGPRHARLGSLPERGQYGEAVSFLKGAALLLPQNPTVRYHLGLPYLKVGQQADATEELRRALTVSPIFPEAQRAKEALDSL
jgi:Flp pilus assembly protein TadD